MKIKVCKLDQAINEYIPVINGVWAFSYFGFNYPNEYVFNNLGDGNYTIIMDPNMPPNPDYPAVLKAVELAGTSVIEVDNNVIRKYPTAISNTLQTTTTQKLRNNLFWQNGTNEDGNPSDFINCLFEDPKLDNDCQPIWTSTIMSPCIDAGTGENDLADGTPPDIGARRAVSHDYWDYTFATQADTEKWYWVSYPVVNSLTQEKTEAETFFEELLGTHQNSNDDVIADVLHEILWSEGGNSKSIEWDSDNNNWGLYIDSLNVSSPQGYKIKLLPVDPNAQATTTVELHHSGFRTPENTPFHLGGTITNSNPNYENWIGYFGKNSAWPNEAFASIWNDITMIRARTWCLYRDPANGVSCLEGKMLPLNPGDMVVVKTQYDQEEFQWNDSTPTDPIIKEMPKIFSYVEKADYTPVYIDLSNIDFTDLKEIGLILDGTCKGAVVVKDTLEQICAYLDDGDSLTSGVVELVFFYENKSQPQELKHMVLKDRMIKRNNIDGNPLSPVYSIVVNHEDMENVIVPVLALAQNYPNPFNPSNSIRFSLDKSGPVSLEIYNIKGQLVKNLCSGTQDIGPHTIIWNGRDNNGSDCSSGVYFYRLKTSDKTLVRKMLMLK